MCDRGRSSDPDGVVQRAVQVQVDAVVDGDTCQRSGQVGDDAEPPVLRATWTDHRAR
jgi:hypothetical protein